MKDKEAIERMYDLIHTCDIGIEEHGEYDDLFQKDKEAIETVLNIIKKQNAEIKNQDNNIDTLVKEQDEREKYIYNLEEKIELKQVRIKNLENENDYLKALVKKKDLEITSLKMEHDYDVKMIDEVKGKAVKLYKEIETLKTDFKNVDHECKKLKQEDIRKDMMINEMVKQIVGLTIFDKEKEEPLILKNEIEVIEYFENKVKESK